MVRLWGSLALVCLVLACKTTVAQTPVRPLVPPLPCCDNPYDPCCPSRAAQCIPLPTISVSESQMYADPKTANQWPISVYEAINIAINNSEVVRNLGLVDANSDVDRIIGNTTTYDPIIARAEAASEWGIFDPLWTTEINWMREDLPPGVSFGGIGNRPPELDTADFVSSIDQLLPSGTQFSFDFVTDYLFNPDRPVSLDPNPQYFSYSQFGVKQPLMRGLGMDVTMAKIRIASAEAERTDWRFKQQTLAMIRSVETAYWKLHSEQQDLRTLDTIIPMFREIVRVRQERQSADAGTASELSRAKAELFRFEQSRLESISAIAEQQLVLRNLLGIPPTDGTYLNAVAISTLAPPVESLESAVYTALRQRPDVLRQRLAVYVAQQEKTLACDSLRPLLDFDAFWRINGLGDDLGSSLSVQGDNRFNDWQMGLTFQIPLGRRQARNDVRARELTIRQQRALLDQVAHQASYEVADAHRRMRWLYQQYDVAQERVAALRDYSGAAKAQVDTPPPGMSSTFALELYLQHLRDYSEAIYQSNAIMGEFNSARARFEEVKGTLLQTRLIEIEGDGTGMVPEDVLAPEVLQPVPQEQPQPAPAPANQPEMLNQPPQASVAEPQPVAEIQQPASSPQQDTYNLPLDPLTPEPAAPSVAQTPAVRPQPTAPQAAPIATQPPPKMASNPASPLAIAPQPVAQAPVATQPSPAPLAMAQPPAVVEAPKQAMRHPVVAAPAPVAAAPVETPAPKSAPRKANVAKQLPPNNAPELLAPQTEIWQPIHESWPQVSVEQSTPDQLSQPQGIRRRPAPVRSAQSQPLQLAPARPAPVTQPTPQMDIAIAQPGLVVGQRRHASTPAPARLRQPTTEVRPWLPEPKQFSYVPQDIAPKQAQNLPQELPAPSFAADSSNNDLAVEPLRQPMLATPPAEQSQATKQPVASKAPARRELQQPSINRWRPLDSSSSDGLRFSYANQPQPQPFSMTPPTKQPLSETPNFNIQQLPTQPEPARNYNKVQVETNWPINLSQPENVGPLNEAEAHTKQSHRWQPLQQPTPVTALPGFAIQQPTASQPAAPRPIDAAHLDGSHLGISQPTAVAPRPQAQAGQAASRTMGPELQLEQPQFDWTVSQKPTRYSPKFTASMPDSLSQPTHIR